MNKYEGGKYIQEVRKIDKLGLFLKLFGWIIIFIGGVWFSTSFLQDYLESFLESRPLVVYGGALIVVAIGFMIQYLGSRRMEKGGKATTGKGGYRT